MLDAEPVSSGLFHCLPGEPDNCDTTVGLPDHISGAGQKWTARHNCVLPYLGLAHCCGSDHAYVCMHKQTQIKIEFYEFFDKIFRYSGTRFQLSSTCLLKGHRPPAKLREGS